jgi:RNA polymerase sigma-70 factor (ECF subfamily)
VSDARLDLDAFYAAVYPRLVGQLTLLTGNVDDAREVASDAVVRLLPRWDKIATFEDPEAWLRTVAYRLAVSRWRRAKVATAGLVRLREAQHVAGPDGTDADLTRALSRLPLGQRQVLVLHHVVGLPLEQIAAELGVAVGTVKSRLGRGRAALALTLEAPVETTS